MRMGPLVTLFLCDAPRSIHYTIPTSHLEQDLPIACIPSPTQTVNSSTIASMAYLVLLTNLAFYHFSPSATQKLSFCPFLLFLLLLLLPKRTLQTPSSLPFPLPAEPSSSAPKFTKSFLSNITASKALTRSQSRDLQATIWPMYFKMQITISALLALTYPEGEKGGRFYSPNARLRLRLPREECSTQVVVARRLRCCLL